MPDIVVEAIRPKRTEFSVPSPLSLKVPNQSSQPSPLMGGKPQTQAAKPPKIKRENSFDKKPASALRIGNPPQKSKVNFYYVCAYFKLLHSFLYFNKLPM